MTLSTINTSCASYDARSRIRRAHNSIILMMLPMPLLGPSRWSPAATNTYIHTTKNILWLRSLRPRGVIGSLVEDSTAPNLHQIASGMECRMIYMNINIYIYVQNFTEPDTINNYRLPRQKKRSPGCVVSIFLPHAPCILLPLVLFFVCYVFVIIFVYFVRYVFFVLAVYSCLFVFFFLSSLVTVLPCLSPFSLPMCGWVACVCCCAYRIQHDGHRIAYSPFDYYWYYATAFSASTLLCWQTWCVLVMWPQELVHILYNGPCRYGHRAWWMSTGM